MAKTEFGIGSTSNVDNRFGHQTKVVPREDTLTVRETSGQVAVPMSNTNSSESSPNPTTATSRKGGLLNVGVKGEHPRAANTFLQGTADAPSSNTLKDSNDLQETATEPAQDNARAAMHGGDHSLLEKRGHDRKHSGVHEVSERGGTVNATSDSGANERLNTHDRAELQRSTSAALDQESSVQAECHQEQGENLGTREVGLENAERHVGPIAGGIPVHHSRQGTECEGHGSINRGVHPPNHGGPEDDGGFAVHTGKIVKEENVTEKLSGAGEGVTKSRENEKENIAKNLPGIDIVTESRESEEKIAKVSSTVRSKNQVNASVNPGTSTVPKATVTSPTSDPSLREITTESAVIRKELGVDSHGAPSRKQRRVTPVLVLDNQTEEAQENGSLSPAHVGGRSSDRKPMGFLENKVGTTGQANGLDAEKSGRDIGSIHCSSDQSGASETMVDLKVPSDSITTDRDIRGDPEELSSEEAGSESDDGEMCDSTDTEDASSVDSDEEDPDDAANLGEGPGAEEDPAVLLELLHRTECAAYEAQENLEEESLSRVREDVRAELAETLTGSELDNAVDREMRTYKKIWMKKYDNLQDESSELQEKLDNLGVDLADIFKQLEKIALEGCVTETWRARTHWVGSEATQEAAVAVKSAEKDLEIRHPMRSQRGKLTAGGASGFLARKLAAQAGNKRAKRDAAEEGKRFIEAGFSSQSSMLESEPQNDGGWSKVDDVLDVEDPADLGETAGSQDWAVVYLASTPEQAQSMGLKLPGVDSVEEIGDLKSEKRSIFKAAAANERKLSERHKIPLKKVREEDDVAKERNSLQRSQVSRKRPSRSHSQLRPNKRSAPEANRGNAGALEEHGLTTPRHPGATEHVEERKGSTKAASTIEKLSDKQEARKMDSNNVLDCLGDKSVGGASLQLANALHPDAVKGFGESAAGNIVPGNTMGVVDIKGKKKVEGRMDASNRKRFRDEGIQLSDDENEGSSKKLKVSDASHDHSTSDGQQGVDISAAELPFDDDSNHLDVQLKIKHVRKICVIDSDGERDVEEVLTDDTKRADASVTKSRDRLSTPGHGGTCNILTNTVREDGERSILEVKQEAGRSGVVDNKKPRVSAATPEKGLADFPCTSCGTILRRKDVKRHPRLPVGICEKCRKHYLSGPFNKGPDGWESECTWCGEGGEVVCCDDCERVFCQDCIGRNFGATELGRICVAQRWICFSCNPVALYQFEGRINQIESENQSFGGDDRSAGSPVNVAETSMEQDDSQLSKGKRRKNIRKVLDDDELGEKQKQSMAREKERKALFKATAEQNVPSTASETQIPASAVSESDDEGRGVVNVARAENEEAVMIDSHLVKVLKDHQVTGVRFMWENCIVSEKKVKEGAESFGCILAHTMGLGKTLQVITFIHTVLNRNLGLRTALIVLPLNVLHNWKREFQIWQADIDNPVTVTMIDENSRDYPRRADLLARWQRRGGVMLIGYAAFRVMCTGKHVKDNEVSDQLRSALQNPGPDILVCDEAHTIKNCKADITQCLKQVKTRRRIALTGSPLQNNLMEYYCMVDFVREGFLGTPPVFKNRFQNPIENGQHADSTERDVKLMKYRAHVLHKELEGFVQRIDTNVIQDELPSRCTYVISVKLSPLQRQLYRTYLDMIQKKELFKAFHMFSKIWNHPELLAMAAEEHVSTTRKVDDLTEDYVGDSDEEKSSEGEADGNSRAGPRPLKSKSSVDSSELDKFWWKNVIAEFPKDDPELSGKTVIVMKILAMCAARGDKALVFTQSLGTLTIVERLIQKQFCFGGTGHRGKPYYRLDGSTPPGMRLQMIEKFNDPHNTASKFMLISTRAGSLGINLPAANRVIIIDGSWNPTSDLQALFRSWRIGQRKPVYAYRLLAEGTMEEKIYGRQIKKQGVAARVLDEQQIGRHFSTEELEFLFKFEDGNESPTTPMSFDTHVNLSNDGETSTAAYISRSTLLNFTEPDDAPRDFMMKTLLSDYRSKWVVNYHLHDPLLEHLEEETLTKEEQQIAWELYKNGEATANASAEFAMNGILPDYGVPGPNMMSDSSLAALSRLHVTALSMQSGAAPTTVGAVSKAQNRPDSAALGKLHAMTWGSAQAAGRMNVSPSPSQMAGRSAQTSSTSQSPQGHTPKSAGAQPSGSQVIRCQIRDHARLLSENKVQVQHHILCPSCKLLVSWEALIGDKRLP